MSEPAQESLERASEIIEEWDRNIIVDHNRIGVSELVPLGKAVAKALDQARDAALKSSPGAMIEAFCEWNARKEPLATYEDAYYAGWQDRALKSKATT